MKFRWTIGRKLAAVFAVALVIQIVVGVMTYASIARMTADQAMVQHSKDVVGALDDMLIAVLDAETGERGYIITGDDAYLAPYSDAETRVNRAIAARKYPAAFSNSPLRSARRPIPMLHRASPGSRRRASSQ